MFAQRFVWGAGLLAALRLFAGASGDRPNILWITAEDMSPHLGCYGDPYATTPNLDRFARRSVRYTRAFATAPVCSPSRSCLITGLYANSLGTQSLRSAFPVPKRFQGFPSYLRAAGYYCSNNVKTDYNTSSEAEIIAASWDESSSEAHWRNRDPDQPFFSIFNLMTTHQSRTGVWSWERFEAEVGSRLEPDQRHDPKTVPLPPYYPDTPLVRRSLARYYDCVTVMDRQVGAILQELDTAGLAENTVVFFYSDHGMGMPRGKRVLYDSGMQVPLLVRFPPKYRHWAPVDPGETVDRLVSFVDFPPTVLSLANLAIPDYMQGRAFLGQANTKPRRYVYGTRDRVDEAFELSRSVRDSRYLYIRNYLPHLSPIQPEFYSDHAPMRRQLQRLASAGGLNPAQLTYAGPGKLVEELYDTEADPYQVRNLAADSDYGEVLGRFRREQRRWLKESRDQAFLPEAEVWRRCESTPYEMGRAVEVWPPSEVSAIAELVGMPNAGQAQREGLLHNDPAVRYWAALGLRASPDALASEATQAGLVAALADPIPSVRIEAAGALGAAGVYDPAVKQLADELGGESVDAVLHAARTLELLGDPARPVVPEIKQVRERAIEHAAEHPCWLFVRFSTESALRNLGEAGDLEFWTP